jgi:GntR family transcriptional regulator
VPAYDPNNVKFKKLLIALQENILSGTWPPGHKLPSMATLKKDGHDYGAVRAAFLVLKARGLIEGRQGDGVFVTSPGNVTQEDMVWISRMLGGEVRLEAKAEQMTRLLEEEFGKFPQLPHTVSLNGTLYHRDGPKGKSLGV